MSTYEAGTIFSSALPQWQRTMYEARLRETLRTKSILAPYSQLKEDFAAVHTGQIVFSEVLDLEPNWNVASEQTLYKTGMSLDSRTMSVNLNWYFDVVKYSDHLDVLSYLNGGDARGIVRDKLGLAMTETMDILARNAYLTHPYKSFGGNATSRATLDSTDLFDSAVLALARLRMQENEIPGIATNNPDQPGAIVCVTTPGVIYDIKTVSGSDWKEAQLYASTQRLFNGEIGMLDGVRFVQTNRLVLRNAGAVIVQDQLLGATVPGQGSAATVDGVYTPGQNTSTRTVPVDDVSGFAVGMIVTIHNFALGTTVLETDGTQETRRIVALDGVGNTMSFDKPLLKAHGDNDYVTRALNVHVSLVMGGKATVLGVAERPNVIIPPKIDDAMLLNRIGWRGMFKFQMFQPEVVSVYETAATAAGYPLGTPVP